MGEMGTIKLADIEVKSLVLDGTWERFQDFKHCMVGTELLEKGKKKKEIWINQF